MRVFIDANIYLGFFTSSGEDLSSLNLVRKYLKKQKVDLIFPKVTQDEFFRNLPKTQSKYLKEAKTYKIESPDGVVDVLKLKSPNIASLARAKTQKQKRQQKKINELIKTMENELEELKKDYIKKSDKLIKQNIDYLILNAISTPMDTAIFEAAKSRRLMGNPPGKSDSIFHIGDEIVWEIILKNCTDDDLIIVSHDGDYEEIINDQKETTKLKTFLEREWKQASNKTITLETTLGSFVKNHLKTPKEIPDAEIKIEESIRVNDSKPGVYAFSPGGMLPTLTSPSGVITASTASINGFSSVNNHNFISSGQIVNPGGTQYGYGLLGGYWICTTCSSAHPDNEMFCSNCGIPKS